MWFNFELEYKKGHDNRVVDVLSWVTTLLDPDTVKSILNVVALGTVHHAKVHDPAMVEGDKHLEQKIHVAAGCTLIEVHVTDWAEAQREDLLLSAVLDWLKAQKQTHFESTSGRAPPPVRKANWSYGIDRILWFIRLSYTYTQHPKVRLKISCSLWPTRYIVLPLWMGATKIQDIKGMTIPCICCGSAIGGQVWVTRCTNLSSPASLFATRRPLVQSSPTPNCGHCSNGPIACGLY